MGVKFGTLYERIIWRMFSDIMRKHGLTKCNVKIENSIEKWHYEEVKFSMPDEHGDKIHINRISHVDDCPWGTPVGEPIKAASKEPEKALYIVKSGAGYVVDTSPGCFPQMTSDPVAAGRFYKSTADAISVSLGLLGLDAELMQVKHVKRIP